MVNYSFLQRKYIILIIIGMLGFFLLFTIHSILSSFLGAIVLYSVLKPVYVYFTEKKKINKTLVTVLLIILSLLVIILPFFLLTVLLVNKITLFAQNPDIVISVINKISGMLGASVKVSEIQRTAIEKISSFTIKLFPSVINSMTAFLVGLLIMYFLLFYMLADNIKFERTLVKYLPFDASDNNILLREFKNITFANIIGQGLIALIQGAAISLGFLMFGIPDALFWGIVSFFLSFLPVLGTPMVYIPAGIYMLAEGNKFSGIGIILWGLIPVGGLDYIIRFILAKKLGNIHPLITVIGLILGIPYFGILGLVFGPLLIAYFILLVKIYERNFLSRDSER